MNVLVLAKRFYTGKDMLMDRYGRIYEFARVLTSLGHSVYGIALDYRLSGVDGAVGCIQEGDLTWETVRLFPNPVRGLRVYIKKINSAVTGHATDIILSVSDVFHVVIGGWVAGKYRLPHVADLYDNYESFYAARIPGAISLFQHALERADGIVCVSQSLATYLQNKYRLQATPQIIRNAVDTQQFLPRNRINCRQKLHLPEGKILVGYGGALASSRGINVLFQAHRELKAVNPDIHLVLAGPVDRYTEIPVAKDIHYLGELEYTDMPEFFGALDVGIVSNKDSSFGRYCFPQKFFEMLACDTPVVIASTGEMADLMKGCVHALFQPEAVKDLARAILKQLDTPCKPAIDIPCWVRQGTVLSNYLKTVAR
jgi:glycosyltransferase involved in cell wall biosynthesis